jgi:hypothetical protein
VSAKERVRQELEDLTERLGKLDAFIGGEKFEELCAEQRSMLMSQSISMATLSQILLLRLRVWDMEGEQK